MVSFYHKVTAAEEVAKYAEIVTKFSGADILLLAMQAWNETTPLKFVQIGFHQEGDEGGYPLKTLIQPTIRIPCSWAGYLRINRIKNLYATFRDVLENDELLMRFAIG